MTERYLFPQDYMADPSVHVFGDRLYIYPSHDYDSGAAEDDDGGHFQMRDYHVLSLCGDPLTAPVTDHGRVLDVDDVPWAACQMWDNDVVEQGGIYHMIFPAKDRNGLFRLGMAEGPTPTGPFTPLPDPIRGAYSIDPCLFKDDDGSIYVYFGGLWGGQLQRFADNRLLPCEHLPQGSEPALPARVARMTADVRQLAEAPRPVIVVDDKGQPLTADNPHRFFEASWMHKQAGRYIFSYSTGDTHLLCYAVGDNPYGPFTYRGVLLEPVSGWTTHHSIVQYQGRWWLFHHDCVPSHGTTWLRSLKVKPLIIPDV